MRGVSSEATRTVLPAGEVAPDFDLPALIGGVKKRFHLRGQLAKTNVVLAFYPLNWEPVSARQLVEYQAQRQELAPRADMVAISVDSIMNTTVWERDIGPLDFTLGSDFWPHGEVSRSYGVFRETGPHAGSSGRAVFLVERSGKIAFSRMYGSQELPPLSELLEALRKL
ncbi:MAG: redoxin domain-containing protein [Terriglobales bacterium]